MTDTIDDDLVWAMATALFNADEQAITDLWNFNPRQGMTVITAAGLLLGHVFRATIRGSGHDDPAAMWRDYREANQ